jgi:hypothetical protein
MNRKKIFETTHHFRERMIERNMPHPYELGLRIANRKTKNKIKESCPNEGFKSECIYWTQIVEQERFVYVTVQKEINHYILLTCFKYKL